MPAISTGRNAGSARGRSAGRHKTKRDVAIQHTQTQRQTRAVQRAAAPANRRAQAEKERKDVLRKTAPSRQLGEGGRARGYEPTRKPRETGLTVAGPRGMSVKHVQGQSTGDAVSKLLKAAGKRDRSSGQTAVDQTLASAIPVVQLLHMAGGRPRRVAQNLGKDVVNAPQQVVPSAIQTVAAANEARKGNWEPAKQMAKDFDATDPVWNVAVAGVNAARGDTKGALKRLKAAGKSAEEHPGFTALEVYGLKGATGRLITRGARATRTAAKSTERLTGSKTAGRVASRAGKIASTERAPRRLPGTNLVQHRKYSDDAITRAFQKRRDRRRSKDAGDLYQEAEDLRAKGQHTAAAEKRAQARKADPQIIRNKDIKRAVDEHVDASEQVRRRGLAELLRAMRKEKTTGRQVQRGGPLASIFAQKITKADLGELRAYRDRLIAEGRKFDPDTELPKIHANEKLVADLDAAIKGVESGKIDMDRIKSIADRYIERSRASQQELSDRGLIDPHEAERAALTPHAVVNLDARREPETLEAVAKAAGKKAQQAQNEVKAAKGARRELTGTQKSQRGRSVEARLKREAVKTTKARKGAVGTQQRARSVTEYMKLAEGLSDKQLRKAVRAEEKRTAKAAKADARLKAAKERAKTAKTAAKAARDRAAQNPLVRPNGEPLSTEEIKASAEGVPAFISNRPRGIGRPYVGDDKPPKVPGDKRSGEAAATGTFDASPETLLRQEMRTHSIVQAFDSFKRLLDTMAYRGDGEAPVQHETFKDADALARQLEAKDGRQWVPVRANPLGADKAQLKRMLEGTSDKSMADLLESAGHASDSDGPWVVLPATAVKRVAGHMKNLDPQDAERFVQAAFSNWRKIVLSLSIPWYVGNVAEASLRSALNLVGPRAYVTGRRALKDASALAEKRGQGKSQLEQDRLRKQAQLGEARTIGSGKTSQLLDRAQMHRDATQYEEGLIRDLHTKLGDLADKKVGAKAGAFTAARMKDIWDAWTHFTMQFVNRGIENTFQTAMLGKAIRNQRRGAGQKVAAVRPKILMTDRARELSAKAAEEQAEGVLSESTAAALGREIDRMYGRYSKMSPLQRRVIANYTPFIAWFMNAARFVGRLPEDHPTFTAVVAAQERLSEEWRKEHGLDAFMGEGKVPAWLQGSVPGSEGEHYRAPTKYTPFSLGVDPGAALAQQFNPQLNGILNALQGKDWKGDDLKDSDGKKVESPMTIAYALKAFIEGTIPGVSLGQQIKKKGPRDYVIDAVTGRVKAPAAKGGAVINADPFSNDSSEDDGVEWTDDFEDDSVDWE